MYEPPPHTHIAGEDHDLYPEAGDEHLQDSPEDYELVENYPVISDEEEPPDQPEIQRLGHDAYVGASIDQNEREGPTTEPFPTDDEVESVSAVPAASGGGRDNDPPRDQDPGAPEDEEPENEKEGWYDEDDDLLQVEETDGTEDYRFIYTTGISDEHIRTVIEDGDRADPIGDLVEHAFAHYIAGDEKAEGLPDEEVDIVEDEIRHEILRRIKFADRLNNLATRMEDDLGDYSDQFPGDDIVITMDSLDEDGEPIPGQSITTHEPNTPLEMTFDAIANHPFEEGEEGTPFANLLQKVRESDATMAFGIITTAAGERLSCRIDAKVPSGGGGMVVEVASIPLSPGSTHFVLRADIQPSDGSLEFSMRAKDGKGRHPDMKSTDILSFAKSVFQYCEGLGIDIQRIDEHWSRGNSVIYDQYMGALAQTNNNRIEAAQRTVSGRIYRRWGFEVMSVEHEKEGEIIATKFKKQKS